MPQPKLGRITRSPGAVSRMMRIDCRMSSSYSAVAMSPVRGSRPTGIAHPRPRKSLRSSKAVVLYPIMTVGAPNAIALGAPASTIRSPCRAAGRPPMFTVGLPMATTPPTCGLMPSTSGHACMSEIARQAGIPPMNTVGQPGPGPSGVPWLVMSPTRAAGCPIARLSIDVHRKSTETQRPRRLHVQRRGRLNSDRGRLDGEIAGRLDRHCAGIAVDLDHVAALVLQHHAVVVEHDLAAFLVRELDHAAHSVIEQQMVLLARG